MASDRCDILCLDLEKAEALTCACCARKASSRAGATAG